MQNKAKIIVQTLFITLIAASFICLLLGYYLLFWIFLAILLAFLSAFSWLLVSFSLDAKFPYNMIRFSDYTTERTFSSFQKAEPWFAQNARKQQLVSEDGLHLESRLIKNENAAGNHRYAIIVHGYGNQAIDAMCVYAKSFYNLSFHVLTPSLRAHKPSEGRWISMGIHEKEDIKAWCRYLKKQDPKCQILLFGVSMGAASVMMCTDDETLPVFAVVEDCGYSSAKEEFRFQLKQLFGLPGFPVLQLADLFCFLRTGFFFHQADSIKALAQSRFPVLMIHGNRDGFVPFSMLETCFQSCTGPKQKAVFEGARHAESMYKDPEKYWSVIDQFLKKLNGEKMTAQSNCQSDQEAARSILVRRQVPNV